MDQANNNFVTINSSRLENLKIRLSPGRYFLVLEPSVDTGTGAYTVKVDDQLLPTELSPVVDFSFSPILGIRAGESVRFTSSVSHPNGDNNLRYLWDFDFLSHHGGVSVSSSTQADQEVTYRNPGTYLVSLLVTDSNNNVARITKSINIGIGNQHPAPYIRLSNRFVEVGESVSFDARASRDSDGRIVKYEWDFRDGNHAEGQVLSHSFAEPGNYDVKLTTTDNEGATGIGVAEIEVGYQQLIQNATPIQLDQSISSTLASNKADAFKFTIPSKSVKVLRVTGNQFLPRVKLYKADGSFLNRTYGKTTIKYDLEPGDYVAIVRPQRLRFSAIRTYDYNFIVDQPSSSELNGPFADFKLNRVVGDVGDLFTMDSIVSHPLNDNNLSFRWSHGTSGGSPTSLNTSRAYAFAADFVVNIRVTDSQGIQEICSKQIFVQQPLGNVPVADFVYSPSVVTTNSLLAFDARSSTGNNLSYSWNFGDGQMSSSDRPHHRYQNPGLYTVELKISDKDGLEDSFKAMINVLPGNSSVTGNGFPTIPARPAVNPASNTASPASGSGQVPTTPSAPQAPNLPAAPAPQNIPQTPNKP